MPTALCDKIKAVMSASPSRILEIKGSLTDSVSKKLIENLEILDSSYSPIVCLIDCKGGLSEEGIRIYEAFRESKSPLIGIVEKYAISAGFIAFQGCDHRYAASGAKFQIHAPEAFTWGLPIKYNSDEIDYLEEQRKAFRFYQPRLVEARAKTIGFLREKSNVLTEEQIEKLLEEDKIFESSDALCMGFIDEIYDC